MSEVVLESKDDDTEVVIFDLGSDDEDNKRKKSRY